LLSPQKLSDCCFTLLRVAEWGGYHEFDSRTLHSMTTRTIGPFQLDRQIGVGGMGVVYSAIYPQNGKTVAVKLLAPGLVSDPKVLKRFEREMEILKRLNHPNIVKYYGGGTDGDQRYYVMEYIDGGSLLDVLKLRDRLTWDKAIQVGRQVASALEHAHNAGIIHRDLKPANLFLTKKGRRNAIPVGESDGHVDAASEGRSLQHS
jgi:serine/threonine protein kinase